MSVVRFVSLTKSATFFRDHKVVLVLLVQSVRPVPRVFQVPMVALVQLVLQVHQVALDLLVHPESANRVHVVKLVNPVFLVKLDQRVIPVKWVSVVTLVLRYLF